MYRVGDFWQHMLVAGGHIDAALDPVVSVWDLAAFRVIVEEAGGRLTDWAGHGRLDGGSALSSTACCPSTRSPAARDRQV